LLILSNVIGESSQAGLDESTLTAIVREALDVVQPGERVLAIIPDKTRDETGIKRTRKKQGE